MYIFEIIRADISMGDHTSPHFIQHGLLSAERYLDKIVGPIPLPCVRAVGEHFIPMDDNICLHRSNLIT